MKRILESSTLTKSDQLNQNVANKYEIILSVFLLVLAFLYRDNPHLVYPQVLYLLLALLVLNLAATAWLKLWPNRHWSSSMIILLNCGVITALLNYSGGAQSNLWVLYLLPIFTACLLLNGIQVGLITFGALLFNLVFHYTENEGAFILAPTIFDLGIKWGLILFASGFTWRLIKKERVTREKFARQRKELAVMEESFETNKNNLAEIEKMADLGQMASGVTHDLNNPLTVIVGTTMILLEDENKNSEITKDLERILRSAQLCQNIVSNLLNMSKNQELIRSQCHVKEMIDSTLTIFEPTLNRTQISVKTIFGENLPQIDVSQPLMQRVILNILSNAQSMMPSGGEILVSVDKYTRSHHQPFSNFIRIVIEDNGPGIEKSFMEKMFKPFHTTKSPDKGTGLGLYLCREIILKHDGQLTAENRPEGGARFTILLPTASSYSAAA